MNEATGVAQTDNDVPHAPYTCSTPRSFPSYRVVLILLEAKNVSYLLTPPPLVFGIYQYL
ncbi:hypothetical protein BABINDRAFT_159390 [Babjeviella inositovora NRRL Y-12698]|uniref:Uncharacterized protein n=1 Tax=Babjeviella inositovora NRRL Y-12698 TaxID=984486 RepID=A0A1E3R0I2_9ASCO|nr:uncharacterized protein BABINDRAFT_159390 [Babjeviella inositovora NRRL Y-12698]ODQ82897.1 hypothetical protein BABINDRAFT_159390 [Babjeviella inositovora NRRL Y-12698]